MFSQTVEYALRAVAHLVLNEGTPQKTSVIAEKTKVPLAYLSKILQELQRKEIVTLQRGIGGGVTLTHSAEVLTVLDVINAVDPIKRIDYCPLGIKSHGKRLCSLHTRLDDSIQHMEKSLGGTTISDLLKEPNPSRALCDS
ncbi:MAG: Rrf2 family transcriptional regulator [Planctomycetes bacterium]|nr:Rrf2 family transcriptional regulator [Planctomycetota bacterium]